MLGTTEITISLPIYNEMSTLSLTGDSIPVPFSVGGMLLSILHWELDCENLLCYHSNVCICYYGVI